MSTSFSRPEEECTERQFNGPTPIPSRSLGRHISGIWASMFRFRLWVPEGTLGLWQTGIILLSHLCVNRLGYTCSHPLARIELLWRSGRQEFIAGLGLSQD